MAISRVSQNMRIIHRYLGFFLAGIMAVYSVSGLVLVFRDTDLLKKEVEVHKTLASDLEVVQLGKELKIKNLKIEKEEGDLLIFKNGQYNQATGESTMIKKQLPYVLNQMTHLHKAKSSQPLFFLNLFFGLSLLFFVISSFWMFMPSTSVFKKGMYFTLGGIVLTLALLFI
jgi:uncharacterized iron-regulated membrane protein